jgi:CheY-like chemotaxis protein
MSMQTITEANETKNIYNNSGARRRVLVVEDNEIMSRILKYQLDDLGYDFDVAANGKNAIELLNPKHSLILIDAGLPDISGWHVAKQIKSLKAPLCNIPIIMNSAHADQAIIDNNEKFNDGFIPKPINKKQLELMLGALL